MPLPVTALYAPLLGLVGLVLASLAGRARSRAGVSLGHGGKPELLEAMRRHANFVEYVPLALLLLAVIELNGTPKWWLHTLGVALVASRIVHPLGLHFDRMMDPLRIVGAAGTMIVLLAAVVTAGWQALR
jgi:hypothetical protein